MDYNENSLKQLLSQVNTINEAYKIVKKNTGEDFNLFQILGMETAEVKTHSKFLAELLNPKGSHMQGDIFLKLLIEYLNEFEDENVLLFNGNKIKLNSETSKVQIEKFIGKTTDCEGGRIDIAIQDSKNRLICIENKIYAGEQTNQLLRYYNFATKNYNGKFHLLFLTLDGKETQTLNIENGRAYPISYRKHIVEWLELCKKQAVNLPILRETIGQYINLIKKLTHQTTNKEMEKDIVEIISNNTKNFESSKLIKENFDKALQLLVDQQRNIIIDLFIDSGINFLNIGKEKAIRYDEFFLKLKDFEIESKIYELGINFELGNNYYFFCMIAQGEKRNDRHNNDSIFDNIKSALKNEFENYNLTSDGWTIGKSEEFTIGIGADDYYYPETNNYETYENLVNQILDIKKIVDEIFS